MAGTYDFFFQTFYLKDGSVAVIEDSILEVLKQANKPRVLFLKCFNSFIIIILPVDGITSTFVMQ